MRFDYKNPQLDQLNLTNKQKIALEYMRAKGSSKKASEALGVNVNSFRASLELIRKKANANLPDLHDSTVHDAIPDGYQIKGVSNMVENSLGKPMWVKTDIDKSRQISQMDEAICALANKAPLRSVIPVSRKINGLDLANLYTFSDFHLGMLAWHEEGGDNWNLDIATETLISSYHDMISRSPEADTCIINELGDFEHFSSMLAVTPSHGHVLDSDTRPEKMIDTSWECMDYLISEGLKNHNNVKVVIAGGNHDRFISLARKVAFKRMYRNNDRVEFVDSKNPYHAMAWGRNLLGFHHGDKTKARDLPMLFSAEFRSMMGDTDRTYIHTGHQHHKEIIEFNGGVVEMHRTLAARDSHASYGGWHAERASDAITYHKDFGEFSRMTVRPILHGDC